MQQQGLCWHVHHKELLEFCYDRDGREEYIRTEKSSDEQELRLRLFQFVQGQLPQEVVDARKAFDEAGKVRVKAWEAYGKSAESHRFDSKEHQAFIEARDAHWETEYAYDEAFSNHRDEVEALHAKECPDCPWDGKTILSTKDPIAILMGW